MKKPTNFLTLSLSVIIVLLLTAAGCEQLENSNLNLNATTNTAVEAVKVAKATVVINNGEADVYNNEVSFAGEKTALFLLEKATNEATIELETKEYDFGISVEKIGDSAGGDDGKYWMFYVNGEMPSVGVDQQTVTDGDTVEFKFE